MITDSVLSLVGRTPCVPIQIPVAGTARPVWLKLEGFNPTGTIFDRIAATAQISGPPHVVDDGPLAASLALVTSTIGLSMTITQPAPALFGAMARALGAQDAEHEQSSGFTLNIDRVFDEIRAEIQTELSDRVRILIPVLPPAPANPATDFTTQRLLAAMGVLVDARSAAVVRQAAELPGNDPVAVVCLADGAIDQDGAL
jgi:cysteine synthase